MSSRSESRPWWLPLATTSAGAAIRGLGATWRIEWVNVGAGSAAPEPHPCIFPVLHARMLPFAIAKRDCGVVVLVSRHRDGEWIARIVRGLGFGLARGSTTRGGDVGMRQLIQAARQGRDLGVTPDGPRGPAGTVKPGVVALARLTGLPIVPMSAASRGSWSFGSWDRIQLPRPFARVLIARGEPILVPRRIGEDEAEGFRLRVEEILHALTRDLDARAGV